VTERRGDGWVSLGELLREHGEETAACVMTGREERLVSSSDDVRSRSQQERRAAEHLRQSEPSEEDKR
jgi:hypothetical protein